LRGRGEKYAAVIIACTRRPVKLARRARVPPAPTSLYTAVVTRAPYTALCTSAVLYNITTSARIGEVRRGTELHYYFFFFIFFFHEYPNYIFSPERGDATFILIDVQNNFYVDFNLRKFENEFYDL
jgi:hypothetical protein